MAAYYTADSRQYWLWEWRRLTNPRQGGGREGLEAFHEQSIRASEGWEGEEVGEEPQPDPLFFEVPTYLQEWCNGREE